MKTLVQDLGTCVDEESSVAAVDMFSEALCSGRPFHLVTLDIHMPDMDGTEVLYKIRQAERDKGISKEDRAKVFMVTSQSDKDSLITCLQAGCDGFIVKPFTRETLMEKFSSKGIRTEVEEDRAAPSESPETRRARLIMEISEALRSNKVSLPSLPDINTRLREMVDSQADMADITSLLKNDITITGSLISLSNSPLFAGVEKNKTLEDAIGRLGIPQTVKHVDVLAQKKLYTNVPKKYASYVDNLWKHARFCAQAAQSLSDRLGRTLSEDPFVLGLVHDIGRLILIQIICKMREDSSLDDEKDDCFFYETLDAYHGEFGAALLKKWGFSKTFEMVARHHEVPGKAPEESEELLVVCLGNALAHHHDMETDRLVEDSLVSHCMAKLGLDKDALGMIRSDVAKIMESQID